MNTRFTQFLVVLLMAPAFSACSHINVQQVAYEVLRQHDCQRNRLESFCERTYAKEYHQYAQIRDEFLRSQVQSVWRVNRNAIKLRDEATFN